MCPTHQPPHTARPTSELPLSNAGGLKVVLRSAAHLRVRGQGQGWGQRSKVKHPLKGASVTGMADVRPCSGGDGGHGGGD